MHLPLPPPRFPLLQTDYKVEVYRSPWGRIITALLILGALAASLYTMREEIPRLISWVRGATFIWVLAGVAVYFIAVSGTLYDIIRGVPPFGYDPKTKRLILFAQSSGTQYAAEGWIIGALNVGCGFAVVFMSLFAPRLKDASNRASSIVAMGCVFILFFYSVWSNYRYKNPWYNPFTMRSQG